MFIKKGKRASLGVVGLIGRQLSIRPIPMLDSTNDNDENTYRSSALSCRTGFQQHIITYKEINYREITRGRNKQVRSRQTISRAAGVNRTSRGKLNPYGIYITCSAQFLRNRVPERHISHTTVTLQSYISLRVQCR